MGKKLVLTGLVAVVIVSVVGLNFDFVGEESFEPVSPYNDVDWDESEVFRYDPHVHTGDNTHEEVFEAFKNNSYDAVAVVDNWEHKEVDYGDTEFLVVESLTVRHENYSEDEDYAPHTKGYFSDGNYENKTFEEVSEEFEEHEGVRVFAHPSSFFYDGFPNRVSEDWFIQQMEDYDHYLGIEVVNHVFEENLVLFDTLLDHFGGDRPVYGLGVTDGQGLSEDMGIQPNPDGLYGMTKVVAEELEEEEFKQAKLDGQMFWVLKEGERDLPEVEKVDVGEEGIRVETEAGRGVVRWVYGGETIEVGEEFDVETAEELGIDFVRFEILSDEGRNIIGSQGIFF